MQETSKSRRKTELKMASICFFRNVGLSVGVTNAPFAKKLTNIRVIYWRLPEEYFEPRQTVWQEAGENCKMWSFYCTLFTRY
jgi:hypothetical protein